MLTNIMLKDKFFINKLRSFKVNKYSFFLICVLFTLSLLSFPIAAANENLVTNEGFEDELANWETLQWDTRENISFVEIDYNEFISGAASVKLTNLEDNDLRINQVVTVKENEIYKN